MRVTVVNTNDDGSIERERERKSVDCKGLHDRIQVLLTWIEDDIATQSAN